MKRCDCTYDVCEELCEHPQAICLARADMVPEALAQQVTDMFRLLGDITRFKILQALSKRELCVCDIAAVVQMGQSAVSHQLRLLRSARLVKYRKEGTMACYSLNDHNVATLLQYGVDHVRQK
ncbi:MAG TPA: metalloregulator ArsR/SmtB family transcription factor [Selenomonadales bacterium]|nr:metalloregulator ArsR/SmtB family transcription factor [Selenomonadales bacterium]